MLINSTGRRTIYITLSDLEKIIPEDFKIKTIISCIKDEDIYKGDNTTPILKLKGRKETR